MFNIRRLFCVFVLIAGAAWPQEFRSSISGRVLDSQAAGVPGAKVTAAQIETGAQTTTLTGDSGQYTLPFIAPGSYKVMAEAPAFKRYVREGLRVGANERLELDIVLELGAVAETITIRAEAPMLQTATASSGQIIDTRQIANMPMAGRTPLVLSQLAFGVIPVGDPRTVRPFDNTGPSTFSMGGTPLRSNEILLDGAPNMNRNNEIAYNAPVDAVAEVKVETFQADAAYGHAGGGTVNIILKSGTNGLHGSAWEFNQVSKLAATPFFTNSAGQKKLVTRFNQWGLTTGGPVVIPKIVDGRNRLFFFFGYEGVRDFQPRPTFSTVPTAAERRGDLSQLLSVNANYQIYDPLSGVIEGARIRRQPLTNNIVPSSRINPVALNYLKLYPLPTLPGRVDGQDNLFANTTGEANKFQNELGRLDINASNRHKLFFSFRFNERYASGENPLDLGNYDRTASIGRRRTNAGTTLDDVFTFGPTTVLNTRLNWTRYTEEIINWSKGFDITSLGFPAPLAAAATRAVLPRIRFDRFTGMGDVAGSDKPDDIFQLFSSLTKIIGKHSLKFGGDVRQLRQNTKDFGLASGNYMFSSNWTRGPLDSSAAAPLGQDLAAFLLGLPTSGGFDVNASASSQSYYYSLFLQDDVKVRPNLTLNLGIRWERDTGTSERYNRTTIGFDFTTPNPIDAQASAAYNRNPVREIPVGGFRSLGGPLFATSSARTPYQTQSHYFSPRFGFAWQPTGQGGKTVVRGGMGVFFFPLNVSGINQTGFSQTTDVVPTLDGFLTPNISLTNPFPSGIQAPVGSSLGLATFLGKSVPFTNPGRLNPYSIRWDLSIQRELGWSTLFEIGYVYNHVVHLGLDRSLDFVPRAYLSTSRTRDQAAIDRLTANVPNPYAGLIPGTTLNGSTVQLQQLLRPFPEFTGVTAQSRNEANSYFHMTQARIEKRFSDGLQLLVNYEFSKLIERRSRLNESDPFLEKRIATEDRPQRIVVSASYDMPFGRGKLLSARNPFLNQLISGWILNGIYTAQIGPPLDWANVIYLGGPLNLNPKGVNGAFDTTRFNTNSREQLDSATSIRTFPSRFGNLRQNGTNNIDFSVLKDTRITEKVTLQFRAEFFNFLNHPSFNPPELNPASTNFGKILSQANLPRRTQMALRLVW